jgi:hypothetical protein
MVSIEDLKRMDEAEIRAAAMAARTEYIGQKVSALSHAIGAFVRRKIAGIHNNGAKGSAA